MGSLFSKPKQGTPLDMFTEDERKIIKKREEAISRIQLKYDKKLRELKEKEYAKRKKTLQYWGIE